MRTERLIRLKVLRDFFLATQLKVNVYIFQVYYPFARQRTKVRHLAGRKEFVIPTAENIWEYSGWKNYQVHVGFTNLELTVNGKWPRGTCSGPYLIGKTI